MVATWMETLLVGCVGHRDDLSVWRRVRIGTLLHLSADFLALLFRIRSETLEVAFFLSYDVVASFPSGLVDSGVSLLFFEPYDWYKGGRLVPRSRLFLILLRLFGRLVLLLFLVVVLVLLRLRPSSLLWSLCEAADDQDRSNYLKCDVKYLSRLPGRKKVKAEHEPILRRVTTHEACLT